MKQIESELSKLIDPENIHFNSGLEAFIDHFGRIDIDNVRQFFGIKYYYGTNGISLILREYGFTSDTLTENNYTRQRNEKK